MKKCIAAVVICMVFLVMIFVPRTAMAAPETILRFAGQLPPDHPGTGHMNDIAKEVLERSNGRIELKIYPSNQLGDY